MCLMPIQKRSDSLTGLVEISVAHTDQVLEFNEFGLTCVCLPSQILPASIFVIMI